MKLIILVSMLFISPASFAGSLRVSTTSSFNALNISMNDTPWPITKINIPDFVYSGDDHIKFENNNKREFYKSLVYEMNKLPEEEVTLDSFLSIGVSKNKLLKQIMKKTLRADFLAHQEMILPYYKALERCLNDLSKYNDDYKYFNYKCSWGDSDAVYEALENIRERAKHIRSYVETSDEMIFVPALGRVSYNKKEESYHVTSHIITESGTFNLASLSCTTSKCLIRVENGYEKMMRDNYLLNHPANMLKK